MMLLAVTASVALAGCGGSSTPAVTQPTGGATTTGAPSTGDFTIAIAGFAFSPSTLTVPPGATVKATNSDGADHTVTSTSKGKFNAAEISKGETVTFTAPKEAGTYAYICSYHPTMKGTLIVN